MDNFDISDQGVSLGGLTVGMGILVWHVLSWYFDQSSKLGFFKRIKGGWRDLLLPFLPLMLFGSLVILSSGGYVADIAGIPLWGSNQLGGAALEKGMGGNNLDVTRRNNIELSDGGKSVVLLMLVAFVVFWIKRVRGRDWKDQLALAVPVVCGICLGLSDGYAGWASESLGPPVDSLGASLANIL
jgi:hypothetical protein